jgi:hypothetical protein
MPLSVKDLSALQVAANKLSLEVIRERLEYWTSTVGPKFSDQQKHRMNLTRFYAITQIEYCHNFIFRRNFLIKKFFNRACELGFFLMTANKISNIFGWRINRNFKGKLQLFKGLDLLS